MRKLIQSLNKYWKPAVALLMTSAACSSTEKNANSRDSASDRGTAAQTVQGGSLADTLASVCPSASRRGSILVARVAPEIEEGGIAFGLLGDGTGPGVVLCRDVLYADVAALLKLMGEDVAATDRQGRVVIDATPTEIQSYRHDSVLYGAVAPLARHFRALLVLSPDHPFDATIWPRTALLHLKKTGLTQGSAYQSAVREGLLPK